ncbi:PP2C family protein-serine/threonine phosphatase [Actinoplanes sp. URMC 104]|uniref:PP2C family protein-serine/threonine phosphatase n=1 Tax=Actinoplanes sp. URMC 104 TaxID=3423409 RepID=UPI003F1E29E1
MDQSSGQRWFEALQQILAGTHLWRPEELAPALDEAMARLGVRTRVWVIDYEQTTLLPLPQPGAPAEESLPIGGSLAGRVFAGMKSQVGDGGRHWVPMVDGTDRLGVIEFVADTGDPGFLRRCELVGGLIGHLLASTSERGDLIERVRRSRPMSPAAELLWRLLPPLTASFDRAVVSAVLQPCYEVGGDGYDYAVDDGAMHLTVLDAVGRGLEAGLTCAVALSALRASRRAGGSLTDQARAADTAIAGQFRDSRFVTAVLARLDLETGELLYLNAGHPRPLVLRGGRAELELQQGRRLPLGLEDRVVEPAREQLLPDDRLLLYTDGVTEARTPGGDRFGLPRLVELVERNAEAGLPAPETLRRLSHAVLEHQGGPPADDATLVFMQWSATAALMTVPGALEPGGNEDGA